MSDSVSPSPKGGGGRSRLGPPLNPPLVSIGPGANNFHGPRLALIRHWSTGTPHRAKVKQCGLGKFGVNVPLAVF